MCQPVCRISLSLFTPLFTRYQLRATTTSRATRIPTFVTLYLTLCISLALSLSPRCFFPLSREMCPRRRESLRSSLSLLLQVEVWVVVEPRAAADPRAALPPLSPRAPKGLLHTKPLLDYGAGVETSPSQAPRRMMWRGPCVKLREILVCVRDNGRLSSRD